METKESYNKNDYKIIDIEKSIKDTKSYKLMEFNNGFKILNIIDKKTDISAAIMSVNVGSFHEEIYLENAESDTGKGLVHFLEHMLFIENSTYNIKEYGVDYFQNFVQKHGGSTNASTHNDITQYFFTIQKSYLFEALKIFLQFFINPTFNPKYVEKEKHAVDNEYSKNIESDMWKLSDIINLCTKKTHPLRHFSTGNCDTLKCDTSSNNNFILENLHLIFNEFYILPNMIFVIYHNKNIFEKHGDFLFKKIKKIKENRLFNTAEREKIFNNKFTLLTQQINLFPFENKNNALIELFTKKRDNKIFIIFQIPKYDSNTVLYKPIEYIEYLINSYEKNSIYNILITQNLATNIEIDQLEEFGKCALQIIAITLTEHGFNKRDIVTSCFFSLLENINIINKNMYNNIRKISKLQYDHNIINDPLSDIMNSAKSLRNFDAKIMKTHKKDIAIFNEKYIKLATEYLKYLNKNNCIIVHISNKFKNTTLDTKWHKAQYNLINNYNFSNNVDIMMHHMLPLRNICIPKKLPDYEPFINEKYPIKLNCKFNNINIWIKSDNKYNSPKCCIGIILTSCEISKNIIDYVKLKIFNLIFDEIAKKYLNCIIKTGFIIDMVTNDDDIIIIINGFNIYIHKIFEIVMYLLINKNCNDFNDFFEYAVHNYKTFLKNIKYQPPYISLDNKHKEFTTNNYYPINEQIDILNKNIIKPIDIYNFTSYIFKDTEMRCLIQGNIDHKTTKHIVNIINEFGSVIKKCTYTDKIENYALAKVLDVGSHKKYITKASNNKEPNYVLGVYYQIEYMNKLDINYYKKKLIIELYYKIMSVHFFETLRTEKQFGYYVRNKIVSVGNIKYPMIHLGFVVQSNTYDLKSIEKEIFDFNKNHEKKFIKECENIDEYKTIIIKELKSKFNNYIEEFEFNMTIIADHTNNFNKREILIRLIQDIQKEEIIEFYKKYLIDSPSYYIIGINKGKQL